MVEKVTEVFAAESTNSHQYVILVTNGKGTESKDEQGRHLYDEETITQLRIGCKLSINHNIMKKLLEFYHSFFMTFFILPKVL